MSKKIDQETYRIITSVLMDITKASERFDWRAVAGLSKDLEEIAKEAIAGIGDEDL